MGAAALVLLAGQHTIAGIIIGWCLAQVGLNAMQASLTAGVPDHVPVAQRGVVSGWLGLPQTASVVLAVALVTLVVTGNAGYVLIAALVVACALPFALTTPDPPLLPAGRPPFAVREFARSFWLSPRQYPDFADQGFAVSGRIIRPIGVRSLDGAPGRCGHAGRWRSRS